LILSLMEKEEVED